ncbi:MAG: hypothetical protein J5I90_15870, partial [Caldilineales bacterium]|nr:hypothetical protein [Caldilineales bacterium]
MPIASNPMTGFLTVDLTASKRFDAPPDTQLFVLRGDAMSTPLWTVTGADRLGERRPPSKDLPFRLEVLHFNDLHGQLLRFRQEGNQAVFSRIAEYAQMLRRQCEGNPNRGLLFLSGGDDLAGSPFDELVRMEKGSMGMHASYAAYSAAGLNAAVIGNHDLDLGVEALAQSIMRDAHFPVLAANLDAGSSLAGLYFPA